jgi:hypothetical protein
MAGRNGDSAALGSSSIALLQERFKKLQKMKEKRQGKILYSESKQNLQDPLSLGLELYNMEVDFRPVRKPPSNNLRLTSLNKSSFSYEKSDVDTSLHL